MSDDVSEAKTRKSHQSMCILYCIHLAMHVYMKIGMPLITISNYSTFVFSWRLHFL